MSSYIGKIPLPRDLTEMFNKIKPQLPEGYFKLPKVDFFDKLNKYLGKNNSNIQLPTLINEMPQLKPYCPSALDLSMWTSVPYGMRQPIYHRIEPLWQQAVITNLPKDPFINLNRCLDQPKEIYLPQIPGFKIRTVEEPIFPKYEKMKQVVQNCFGSTIRNDLIEINRKIWQVQQLELPKEFKLEVQEFQNQLEKYQGCQLPLEWMVADYYRLDEEQFTQKVLDALGQDFCQLRPVEQKKLFEKKCFELAPIHPLVEKYIPNWIIIKDKALGLDLSKFIEAFNKKMTLLMTTDKLDIIEGATKFKEIFEERINLTGIELYNLLQSFGKDIDFLDTELTKTVNDLNRKIRIGLNHFGVAVKCWAIDNTDNLYRCLACTVLPTRACLRPAFDIKAAIENPQKLLHVPFEKIVAHAKYGLIVKDNINLPFTIEDFERKSKPIKLSGLPLEHGIISYINGMKNQESDHETTAQFIVDVAGGVEMSNVYNASHNIFYDLFQSFIQLRFTASTESVQALKNNILDYFEKNGLDKQMLLICHSQGAIITRNALMELPKEIRDRISVAAFGPAAYIDEKLCGFVQHYVNSWDWLVPSLDLGGRWRCKHTVVRLSSKEQTLWSKLKMGHTIQSETYQSELRKIVDEFVKVNQ